MLKKFIVLSLTFVIAVTARAGATETGVKVAVYIESYNANVLTAEITAAKFGTAIEKAAEAANIPVVYSQSGSETSIYSVNGIKNNYFKKGDGWHGYALRDGLIVGAENYMNSELSEGDIIVLYYGKPGDTNLVSGVDSYFSSGLINFDVYSARDGEAEKTPVGDAKIYLKSPNGSNRILFTDEHGKACARPDTFGVYEYFISDRKTTSFPEVVSPETFYYYHGLENDQAATRAEALAFLAWRFGLSPGGGAKFSDLDAAHKYYDDIQTAYANDLVAGYDDGTFRPDEKISLTQFAIFLSRADKTIPKVPVSEKAAELPEWARQSVSNILAAGILSGVELNWDGDVGAENLIAIYNNFKNYQGQN